MKEKFKQAYMDVAERFAQLSHAQRAKVGAIIVKDDRIISIGYNGMPSGWENVCEEDGKTKPQVLHAETNAIAKLAQSSESGKDAILFCTHLPCIECAKLIYQSGIKEVYYREEYNAAKGSGKDFLTLSGITIAQY
ncbi:dCMP deaminase family protein [bacterium]|nr:dCMP deaminase family protein [bacterium]